MDKKCHLAVLIQQPWASKSSLLTTRPWRLVLTIVDYLTLRSYIFACFDWQVIYARFWFVNCTTTCSPWRQNIARKDSQTGLERRQQSVEVLFYTRAYMVWSKVVCLRDVGSLKQGTFLFAWRWREYMYNWPLVEFNNNNYNIARTPNADNPDRYIMSTCYL